MSKKKAVSISELSQSYYDIFYSLQRMELIAAKGIKDPAERQKVRNRILAKEPPPMPLDMSIGCGLPGEDDDDLIG